MGRAFRLTVLLCLLTLLDHLIISICIAPLSKKCFLWSSPLFSTSTAYSEEELHEKFMNLKKAFPADINPVKAGGWYNLQKLSGDPKTELVTLIVDGLKNDPKDSNKIEFSVNDEKIEALSDLLYASGKGFDADLVDGDWNLVFSKQGSKSPRFQKFVGKGEKAGMTLNVFDIKEMTFWGDVNLLRNKVKVDSKVKVC